MTAPPECTSHPAAAAPAGFWQRRVLSPLRAQFTRGVSPRQLALTLAIGTACSLLPFLGLTSLLNFAAGAALRLNHPILQTLNQLLGPLQLALILVYVRLGEWLWGADASSFTVTMVIESFQTEGWGEFLARFGWAGLHALTAWVVTSPLLVGLGYLAFRPWLERILPRHTA